MAIIAGTTGVYSVGTAGGNREDLEDVIWDLFVEETYCLSNFDRTTATSISHEWMLDSLAAAATNAVVEGNQETYATLANPTRMGNTCQISDKLFLVSRTQEKVAKAGRTSEIQRNPLALGLADRLNLMVFVVDDRFDRLGTVLLADKPAYGAVQGRVPTE